MSQSKIPIEKLKEDRILNIEIKKVSLTLHTTWGLFSPEKIDNGTIKLIEAIEIKEDDNILDLGCGYGAIGITLAKLAPKGTVQMIDKDFVAVEYAKKNADINQAKNTKTYLSNGFDQVPEKEKFQIIVSNLPAKISKEYFWILFEEARQRLADGGKFYVVTIAGLKWFTKKNFTKIFGNYKLIDSEGTYFVASATKQ